MLYKPYRHKFFVAALIEFHRVFKTFYYVMSYGNYKARQVYNDFIDMYQMGGEL